MYTQSYTIVILSVSFTCSNKSFLHDKTLVNCQCKKVFWAHECYGVWETCRVQGKYERRVSKCPTFQVFGETEKSRQKTLQLEWQTRAGRVVWQTNADQAVWQTSADQMMRQTNAGEMVCQMSDQKMTTAVRTAWQTIADDECRPADVADECRPDGAVDECRPNGAVDECRPDPLSAFLRCRPPPRSAAILSQVIMADSSSASVDRDVKGFRRTASASILKIN